MHVCVYVWKLSVSFLFGVVDIAISGDIVCILY